jgi:hypothetical protein
MQTSNLYILVFRDGDYLKIGKADDMGRIGRTRHEMIEKFEFSYCSHRVSPCAARKIQA